MNKPAGNDTLVSKAVNKGVLCDICDRDDDVIEYITKPYFADPEDDDNTVVRYIRLCKKCLKTGIEVSECR